MTKHRISAQIVRGVATGKFSFLRLEADDRVSAQRPRTHSLAALATAAAASGALWVAIGLVTTHIF